MSEKYKIKGKRTIVSVTDITKLRPGDELPIYNSDDYWTQKGKRIEYLEDYLEKKNVLEAGSYSLIATNRGLKCEEFESSSDTIDSNFFQTSLDFVQDIQTFLSNRKVFDRLKLSMRRGWLFWGPAGTGKTFAITKAVQKLREDDPKALILYFRQDSIRTSDVVNWMTRSSLSEDVSCVVFVIEDLGGGEANVGTNEGMQVDSSTLAFLDGSYISWKVPTIFLSTTNYPQAMLENIIDRPGRFDQVMEMGFPKVQETSKYAEHLLGRALTDEEYKALSRNQFSVAHVKELCLRVLVYNKDMVEEATLLMKYKEKVKNNFEPPKAQMGMGRTYSDIFGDD